VLSYYDESADDKTGIISIDWSNDSRIKIRVDDVFHNREDLAIKEILI